MSSSNWIKLQLHPDDAEVARLSELTGVRREICFAAAVKWFWFVDSKCANECAGMRARSVDDVIDWVRPKRLMSTAKCRSFAEAMMDKHVGWLSVAEDQTVIIEGFSKHFGKSAKRRALHARSVAAQRVCAPNAHKTRTASAQSEHLDKKRVDNKQQTTNTLPPPAGKARNLIWDAICEIFGLDPVTKSETTRIGRVVRDLKLKKATPEEIRIRYQRYRSEWPKVSCTPEALLKHWDQLAQDSPSAKTQRHAAPPGKYDELP